MPIHLSSSHLISSPIGALALRLPRYQLHHLTSNSLPTLIGSHLPTPHPGHGGQVNITPVVTRLCSDNQRITNLLHIHTLYPLLTLLLLHSSLLSDSASPPLNSSQHTTHSLRD
ncbi:hypothetical protein Pcinc_019443 [Petrolisthes cinctipes]|uniref:Uncharacterized protein n=1 Tax=Petrolisthes cinctipes TaxID=88211 RepID=A0AAE1FL66_PETCI|nr:hypothetical protein Pcinc_019443 [Petrolisthes cinctipes]